MRRCIVYIATSLDGYIARKDGSFNWLFTELEEFGYYDFMKGISTVVMGRKTFQDCLGLGEYMYKDKENYILTRQKLTPPPEAPHVKFHNGHTGELIRKLKTEKKAGDVWLLGGTHAITETMLAKQVDEFIISVHPIILGSGIPLFENIPETKLELISSNTFNKGLVQLSYKVNYKEEKKN